MREVTGHCPSCHMEGPVGHPCAERSCARRGHHFIPEDAFDRFRELPPARTDPRIGLCIGEYLLVDVLGAGGFGKVYLALQLPILMKTALKVMERPEEDPDLANALAKRFEGEAAALATLTHPNIVRLLKYGVHEGMPYLVMEFVEGMRTLRTEMQSGALAPGCTDPAVTVHVLRQVLNALEAAHARGIVHRDVKPENVMLQEVSGDRWFVKVLDFGLAKFVEERAETSLMVGTPAYMAPEQITRKNIGPWTDLYAVGVLAFRLVTGRLPFLGDSTQETYAQKLDPGFDPMEAVGDLGLSPLLTGFLRQAMARDPESRFRSAAEFRRAFDDVAPLIGTPAEPLDRLSLPEPTPPAVRRPGRTSERGHSLTEEIRRVGDEAFAQVGAHSVVTTTAGSSTVTSRTPRLAQWQPRRRWLGSFEIVLAVLAGLAVGIYLYEYGFSAAPVRGWFARAEAYMGAGTPAGAPASAATEAPERRTAAVRVITTPPGARVMNEDTNDDLGRTPANVLVPPGGTLRLHVQMEGYRDEIVDLRHADALNQPELVLRLVRRK